MTDMTIGIPPALGPASRMENPLATASGAAPLRC